MCHLLQTQQIDLLTRKGLWLSLVDGLAVNPTQHLKKYQDLIREFLQNQKTLGLIYLSKIMGSTHQENLQKNTSLLC